MRTRTRKIIKWTSFSGALILAAVLALASNWYVEYYDWTGKTKYLVAFVHTGVVVLTESGNNPTAPRRGKGWRINRANTQSTIWPRIRFKSSLNQFSVWVPLWCPILLLTLTSALTWRGKKALYPSCSSCEYDLTGNTSGVCPECGAAIVNDHRVSRR